MNCLNCGKEFVQPDNYCSSCGQAATAARMETHDVFHNLFHSFTHTDKGFFIWSHSFSLNPAL
jgi:predicted amidophosphoribosyltransferase